MAVDLANANRLRPTEPTLKAEEALRQQFAAEPTPLAVLTDQANMAAEQPALWLRDNSFSLHQFGAVMWPWFEPREDGKPLLGGAIIRRAVVAGGVLALHILKGDRHELRLFRGPDVTALGVIPLDGHRKEFTLSPDGKRVAWARGKHDLAVAATADPAGVVNTASHAGLHGRCDASVRSEPFRLTLTVGRFRHEFRADATAFTHQQTRLPRPDTPARASPPPDGRRFRGVAGRCGEVLVTDENGTTLAVFVVRREQAAAWTLAGGFWGHPALIGGGPTPNAEKWLAAVLGPEGTRR